MERDCCKRKPPNDVRRRCIGAPQQVQRVAHTSRRQRRRVKTPLCSTRFPRCRVIDFRQNITATTVILLRCRVLIFFQRALLLLLFDCCRRTLATGGAGIRWNKTRRISRPDCVYLMTYMKTMPVRMSKYNETSFIALSRCFRIKADIGEHQ